MTNWHNYIFTAKSLKKPERMIVLKVEEKILTKPFKIIKNNKGELIMEQNFLIKARAEKQNQIAEYNELVDKIAENERLLNELNAELEKFDDLSIVRSDIDEIQEYIYQLGIEQRPEPEEEEQDVQ